MNFLLLEIRKGINIKKYEVKIKKINNKQTIKLRNIKESVEKNRMIFVWLSNAKLFADFAMSYIEEFKKTNDSNMMMQFYSNMISSTIMYTKCFNAQQGTKLEIEKITKDKVLRSFHRKILEGRNKNLIHWEGGPDRDTARYILTVEDNGNKDHIVNFNLSLGQEPDSDSSRFNELIQACMEYLNEKSTKDIRRLNLEFGREENKKYITLVEVE